MLPGVERDAGHCSDGDDDDGDGLIDCADPDCKCSERFLRGDVDGGDRRTVTDAVRNLVWHFSGGDALPESFLDCGIDRGADDLGCLEGNLSNRVRRVFPKLFGFDFMCVIGSDRSRGHAS